MIKVKGASRIRSLVLSSIPLALLSWGMHVFLNYAKGQELGFSPIGFLCGLLAATITNWIGFKHWECRGKQIGWRASIALGFLFPIILALLTIYFYAALDGDSRVSAREFLPYLIPFIAFFWLPSIPIIYLTHR